MAVDITTEPTFSAGLPRLLFEGRFFEESASRTAFPLTACGSSGSRPSSPTHPRRRSTLF